MTVVFIGVALTGLVVAVLVTVVVMLGKLFRWLAEVGDVNDDE